MAIAKRILFFGLVNFLVINSLLILMGALFFFFTGSPFPPGGYYQQMAIFAAVLGMGGSVFSLYISKWAAKRSMGVQIIDPKTTDPHAREIVSIVHGMARRAGLKVMPEVGVYQSPEMNAFATGPSKKNSLVAVSTGLLNSMNKSQVEAVIAHEVAHVANGDMVTLALIQGIVNTFAYFFAYILTNLISSQMERDSTLLRYTLSTVFLNLFSFLGLPVVMWFSRMREYRADAGAARYMGDPASMVSALRVLKKNYFPAQKEADSFAAFKISTPKKGGFMSLFKSHPDLDDRIARLEQGRF